jgi:hypothetical protein
MQNIGTKVVFLICVLLAVVAVASVMNTPEFQHLHLTRPSWF